MENLSLEAKHMLKLMQMDQHKRYEPMPPKMQAAIDELGRAGLVRREVDPHNSSWSLTPRGYDPYLTKL